MTMAMAAQGRRTGRWLAAAAFAGILTTLAAGCANQHPGGASADTMATPSDDTDQRRRARIRLELASSYYEEGKTEVALDEVKQVLVLDPTFGEAYNLRGQVRLRPEHLALGRLRIVRPHADRRRRLPGHVAPS